MRRFVTLAVLLFFTIPFGISISGCAKKSVPVFCNGGSTGPLVGQLSTLIMQPQLYGVSLDYAQIGQVQAPTATDCKGKSVTVSSYTYGTTDMTMADINPLNGRLCGGNWNRNTGGGIADYTTCNPTKKSGVAYVTASAEGVTSNPVAVYVHPVVTSVVLGSPATSQADCDTDPSTNCAINPITNRCTLTVPVESSVIPYPAQDCVSQGITAQLAAKVYAGQQNISCLAGNLTYTPQDSTIVTVDQNGVATAQQPGVTIINASISNAGSSAGSFATCPPKSITLAIPNGSGGSTGTNIVVNQNFTQPITATVIDTKGATLTGVNLTYLSTTPSTMPSNGVGSVTPILPGAGSIIAVCQPPTCNQSPYNQIGLFGNGKQVVSNPINVTTPGTSSTVLYMASTQSQYIVPIDFTSTTIGAPVRLPYAPNSMVMSVDGSTIYMGTNTELMIFNATTNSLSKEDNTVSGTVLAVSPDGNTVVISDKVRQLVYLYSSSGGTPTSYGGVGTHAQFSPDSSTVYITAGNQLLVYSTFSGWTSISDSSLSTPVMDVAVTVPDQGVFVAGATTTARGVCHITSVSSNNGQLTTTNVFYPNAGVAEPMTDRLVATNDGKHIVGVTAASATLTDLNVVTLNATNSANPGQCPPDLTALQFTTTRVLSSVLPGISATSITGVVPSSDSSNVFVTYAGTGGTLPLYQPSSSGAGTLSSVTLATFGPVAPIAPVSGVFSADNTTFYAGTTGDNQVHILTKVANSFQDKTTALAPKLPALSGTGYAEPNLLVQKPRKPLN